MPHDEVDLADIADTTTALVTALLHEDDEAVDFVLHGLSERYLHALAVSIGAYISEHVRMSTPEGMDPTVVWAESVTRMRSGPSA
jgi:hypothetical protein